MTSKRFRRRWILAHTDFSAAQHKQYGNLDIEYMHAIWDAKEWLMKLQTRFVEAWCARKIEEYEKESRE